MMEKIKNIYSKAFDYLRNLPEKINLNKTQKTTAGLVLVLVVLAIILGLQVNSSNKINKTELGILIDNGSNLLEESKNIKTQFLEKKISEQDYNTKRTDVEIKIEELNKTLHSIELARSVRIEEETLESAGDALQVLAYLIFQSKSLRDINDEILALNIILEDIKTES